MPPMSAAPGSMSGAGTVRLSATPRSLTVIDTEILDLQERKQVALDEAKTAREKIPAAEEQYRADWLLAVKAGKEPPSRAAIEEREATARQHEERAAGLQDAIDALRPERQRALDRIRDEKIKVLRDEFEELGRELPDLDKAVARRAVILERRGSLEQQLRQLNAL